MVMELILGLAIQTRVRVAELIIDPAGIELRSNLISVLRTDAGPDTPASEKTP
jgi:hypothetical protein